MKGARKVAKAKRKTAGKSARRLARKATRKATGRGAKGGGKISTGSSTKVAAKRVRTKSVRVKEAKSPAGARPRTREEAMTPPQGLRIGEGGPGSRAEKLRSMLEAKRAEVLEEIRRARQDSLETDRMSFAEVGDLVAASVEKERAFEYGEIGVNALREINTALEKLKAGTFGVCEVCGKHIGLRRLRVMPSARLCIKCKFREEASGSGNRGR